MYKIDFLSTKKSKTSFKNVNGVFLGNYNACLEALSAGKLSQEIQRLNVQVTDPACIASSMDGTYDIVCKAVDGEPHPLIEMKAHVSKGINSDILEIFVPNKGNVKA